jgi:hypothetical protein
MMVDRVILDEDYFNLVRPQRAFLFRPQASRRRVFLIANLGTAR